MCFSENLSYLNFVILVSYGSYIIQSWRLSLPLLYLGLKDLLQGLLYKYLDNSSISTILGTLSYIHICFQPLIFNMAFSYFDTNKNKKLYWNFIFLITFCWGLWKLSKHEYFDLQYENNCTNPESDFCSLYNGGYKGKYHIGYKATTEKAVFSYPLFLFLPSLFTRVFPLSFILLGFVIILKAITDFQNIRDGEFAAIWCFISIIYLLPIAIFKKQIQKWLCHSTS